MGTTINNILIHKTTLNIVVDRISNWMQAKGFEQKERTSLIPFHSENERIITIYSNEKWIVICSSEPTENERMLLELNQLDSPLLNLWLFDSDVWGYELYKNKQIVSAFISNKKYFDSEEDEQPLAENDIKLLCETCDLQNKEKIIRKCQNSFALFKQKNVDQFTKIIDAPPAASSFDDETKYKGFQKSQIYFCKKDYYPLENFKLHEFKTQHPYMSTADVESESPILSEEELNEIQSYYKRGKIFAKIISVFINLLFLPFKVFLFLIKPIIKYQMRMSKTKNSSFKVEGNELYHPIHKCRITLNSESKAQPEYECLMDEIFLFSINNIKLICRSVNPEDVKMKFNQEIIEDECWFVDKFPARTVQYKIKDRNGGIFEFHYIQTPQAIYEFRPVNGMTEKIKNQLKIIVKSFRIEK